VADRNRPARTQTGDALMTRSLMTFLKNAAVTGALALLILAGITVLLAWFNLQKHQLRADSAMRGSADWQVPARVSDGQRVLLLMVDGMSVAAFRNALADGALPNIERLLSSRPTASRIAVSTFPSATSPSVQELLSGQYADMDYLSVPGAVHSFDRDERQIIRYVTRPDAWQWPIPTLFDVVRDEPVVTVFEGRWDGPATILTQYNMASQAILSAIGASALSNGDAGPVETYLDMIRSSDSPVVSLVVLNEFDVAGHFYGPASPEARRALSDCDARIGQIVSAMAELPGSSGRSLLDETTILIFGDHGMVASGDFINLPGELKAMGVKAVDVSTVPHIVFRERLGTIWTQWPDAILVAGGSNVTQIYLRGPSGAWSPNGEATNGEARHHSGASRKDALIRNIRAINGIGQVIWQDTDATIHIADRFSEARILVREDADGVRYAYTVAANADRDPFDYLVVPKTAAMVCRENHTADGCYHSAIDWTNRTIGTPYPGAVPLIPKAFRPARFAGDLIVTARPGYSFINHQNGDHGNLTRESVLTPLIFNGPGIRNCEESSVPRLVDIYPSAAVLLGVDRHDPAFGQLDGRVLDCVVEPSAAARVK